MDSEDSVELSLYSGSCPSKTEGGIGDLSDVETVIGK